MAADELSPGQIQQPVTKNQVGPLILAIKAQNAQAVKDLLEAD